MKCIFRKFAATSLFIVLSPIGFADAFNSVVSEQVASHFEQVFSPYGDQKLDRNGWLPGDGKPQMPFDLSIDIDFEISVVGSADVVGTDQSIRARYSQLSYSLSAPFKAGKKLSFFTKRSFYSFDELEDSSNYHFDYSEISEIDVGLMYTTNLSPKWDMFLGAGGIITNGDGAKHLNNPDAFVFVGATYTFNPNLTWSFGIPLSSNIAYDSGRLGIFMLDWRINDRNHLTFSDGVYYRYALTKDWRNSIGISIEDSSVFVEEAPQVINGVKYHHLTRSVSDSSLNICYTHKFKNDFVCDVKFALGHFTEHQLLEKGGDSVLDTLEISDAMGMSIGLSRSF